MKWPVQFTVTPHKIKQKRTVKVFIYENVADMREAAERYDRKTGIAENQDGHADTLGVTHRFEWIDVDSNESKPQCAIIRLVKDHLTMRIISHEAAHAAVWIFQIDVNESPPNVENIDEEEHFCHLVSDIASDIVHEVYKRNIIEEPKQAEK